MGAIAKAFSTANSQAQLSPRDQRMGDVTLNSKAGWLP